MSARAVKHCLILYLTGFKELSGEIRRKCNMKNFMSKTRGTLTWFLAMELLAALASASLTLAGCEDIAGGIGGKPADITYDVTPDGSAAAPSTKIDFTFSAAVTGLTEDDITLTNDTGAVTKGTLSGGGTSWSLGITVQTAGNVKVSINKEGIENTQKPVKVYKGQTAASCTITFNADGGSPATQTRTVSGGWTVGAGNMPTATKSGYTFGGWYTSTAGNGSQFTGSTTVNSSITVYAKLTASSSTQYTITFNSNSGSAVAAITANAGTALNKPADPTKTGYTFSGWYSAAIGGIFHSWPYTLNGNISMYAQWTTSVGTQPTQYTITFNSQGGSAVAAITANAGSTLSKPADPTKTGYTLSSWYNPSNGGTQYNWPYPLTGNVTMYAQWTPIT